MDALTDQSNATMEHPQRSKPINIGPWENENSLLSAVIALLGDFVNLHLVGLDKGPQQDAMNGIIQLLCRIVEDGERDFNKARPGRATSLCRAFLLPFTTGNPHHPQAEEPQAKPSEEPQT